MADKRQTWRRARARRAEKALERVLGQLQALADEIGRAKTPGERLGAAVSALRAAAAPGGHQPDQKAANQAVELVADAARGAALKLLLAQETAARTVLEKEGRRDARAEAVAAGEASA